MVRDLKQSTPLYVFQAFVHGFRMPLFMLLSGFFTAMLWRKRGLKTLLVNRFHRVLLPCVAALVTVVPAIHWSEMLAFKLERAPRPKPRQSAVISAEDRSTVKRGKIEVSAACFPACRQLAGSTLEWFHARGIARLPAERGHTRCGLSLGGTPFGKGTHTDYFGPDPVDVDIRGLLDGPVKTCCFSWPNVGPLPEGKEPLVIGAQPGLAIANALPATMGRELQSSLFVAARNDAATQLINHPDTGCDCAPSSHRTSQWKTWTKWLGGPVFVVVWFLWFLVLFLPFFAVYTVAVERFRWRMRPCKLIASQWSLLWLVPLTLVPASRMGGGSSDFGPDTSMGIFPVPHVFAYYAVFFGFGVLYHDYAGGGARIGRSWSWTFPTALFVAFPLGLELASGAFGFRESLHPGIRSRPLGVVFQVLYAWLMSFACIGIFSAWVKRESRLVRYLVDASYWCYLAHLPVVILAQALVCRWPLPALLKFSAVFCMVTVAMFISYEKLVRNRWIGLFLNGARSPNLSNAHGARMTPSADHQKLG